MLPCWARRLMCWGSVNDGRGRRSGARPTPGARRKSAPRRRMCRRRGPKSRRTSEEAAGKMAGPPVPESVAFGTVTGNLCLPVPVFHGIEDRRIVRADLQRGHRTYFFRRIKTGGNGPPRGRRRAFTVALVGCFYQLGGAGTVTFFQGEGRCKRDTAGKRIPDRRGKRVGGDIRIERAEFGDLSGDARTFFFRVIEPLFQFCDFLKQFFGGERRGFSGSGYFFGSGFFGVRCADGCPPSGSPACAGIAAGFPSGAPALRDPFRFLNRFCRFRYFRLFRNLHLRSPPFRPVRSSVQREEYLSPQVSPTADAPDTAPP